MEFARRGPAVEEDVDYGRCFPDHPPPHGDTMPVIRDVLLSQLQMDLQEIIMAEIAKIDRAKALRSASLHDHSIASASAEQATPVPFASSEKFMPHYRGAVGPERNVGVDSGGAKNGPKGGLWAVAIGCLCWLLMRGRAGLLTGLDFYGLIQEKVLFFLGQGGAAAPPARPVAPPLGVDDVHELDMEDGAYWGVELKSEKPAMEDTICESNENTLPKKTSSSVKWRCAICQVEATSEGNLLQHFAGLKHRSNAIALKAKAKAKAKAEKSTKARQYAEEPRPTWVCRFCQANCTCKSDLENHLKSNRHDRKIQALLEESKRMARNSVSWEVDSHPNIVPQDEGKPVSSVWICIICQVKCTSQSIMDSHLKGKKHQINVQALQLEAKRVGNTSPQIAKNQQPPKEWDCRSLGHRQKLEAGMNAQPAEKDRPEPMEARWTCWLCLAKCTCAADYHNHLIGRRHRENTEALRADPGKTAADLKSAYYCALCDVQCSGEKQMASHLGGRRHREMLEDPDTE
uniref:Matrin-type domain-containing protein n=1 Tax=Arundo donax TaxID=35708 RepID=A0A0A8YXS2_ARUDO